MDNETVRRLASNLAEARIRLERGDTEGAAACLDCCANLIPNELYPNDCPQFCEDAQADRDAYDYYQTHDWNGDLPRRCSVCGMTETEALDNPCTVMP